MRRDMFGKKKIARVEQIAQDLENGAGQAFASVWYFKSDSEMKGQQWGYAAKSWAKRALKELEELFPDEKDDE